MKERTDSELKTNHNAYSYVLTSRFLVSANLTPSVEGLLDSNSVLCLSQCIQTNADTECCLSA